MTSSLEQIDFGRLDAESDPKLLDYFLVTGTVGRTQHGAKLVVGRKGSGKTALFRHLSENVQGVTVALDLVDYVFEVHKGLLEAGLQAERAYVTSWKLLIYSAAFAQVRDELTDKERGQGDKFLADLGLGASGGRIRAIANWLKRIRKVELPSVTGLASAGSFEMTDPDSTVLSVDAVRNIDALGDLLRVASRSVPIVVLLDRLDDAWDGTDTSLELIGGAIRATRDISIAWGQEGPAPVISFLRSDLWERLSFNDKNKMSQDIVYLDWTPDQLAEVIDLRIHSSTGTPIGKGWEKFFTTDEMRQRAQARTYIIKRTMGRPRDVVAFAVFAREAALAAGHGRIEAADIYAAEQVYSKHVLDELRDEIERHVSDYTAVLNTLKTIGKRSFTRDAFLSAAGQNDLNKAKAVQALEQLFEASAVGVHGAGGAQGGSQTTYRYQDRLLRPQADATLQVHLALVRELSLRDA